MAETEDPAAVAARLEAALERIARLAAQRASPPDVAARLDALIAQLRKLLPKPEE
jgi:hypothetical protein